MSQSSNLQRLRQLITIAGGKRRLAGLLCLPSYCVRDWLKLEQISLTGALLVDSTELAKLINSRYLRPDISPVRWIDAKKSKKYLASRECQEKLIPNPIESPIEVMKGLLNDRVNLPC